MARTTPRTWTVSELVTAAMMNAEIRDNLNAMWPFTAANQLAVSTAANAVTKLDAGTEGYILGVSGGTPAYVPIASIITSIVSGRSGTISTSTASNAYVDMTGATVTVTPTATCNILLLGSGNLTSAGGATEYITGTIDGTDQQESINVMSAGQILMWTYFAMKTAVGTGPRIAKLRYKASANTVNFYNGVIMAIVLPA